MGCSVGGSPVRYLLLLLSVTITTLAFADPPRETSTQLEWKNGELSYYVAPHIEQAGTYPRLVGEVFSSMWEKYPGLRDLPDGYSVEDALQLTNLGGMSHEVTDLLPGAWEPLRGIPLAFFAQDLVDAGYSGELHDARLGLLDLFSIHLTTPEHITEFPPELVLVIDLTKGTRHETLMFDMFSENRDGVYRYRNPSLVYMELGEMYRVFPRRKGFADDPTEMRASRLVGFDPETMIQDLPPLEGAILVHHLYIGSYRVVSGWQWAGRPLGLHGSQQKGFVQ